MAKRERERVLFLARFYLSLSLSSQRERERERSRFPGCGEIFGTHFFKNEKKEEEEEREMKRNDCALFIYLRAKTNTRLPRYAIFSIYIYVYISLWCVLKRVSARALVLCG
jgi:hypothetical protein